MEALKRFKKISGRRLASDGSDILCASLEPYKSNGDFLSDLASALESDYGLQLSNSELRKAGENIDSVLGSFL